MVYDELTINERQKKDPAFSSMLDEVRRVCPSQKTVQAIKCRVISTPVVDKFEELMASGQSPLCLFPTRQACHDFNSDMLSKQGSEVKEIPCVAEVDERRGTFKWSKKATQAMEKLNNDCNLTAGLDAVLKVAVGARVMLRRNIDTGSGLVSGALGTVISIKAHHITVQFDGMTQPYPVERVKGRFVVMCLFSGKSSHSSWHLPSLCTSARVCRWTVPSWTCPSKCFLQAWRMWHCHV